MEWDEFRKLIGHICHYWERKIPSEEQGFEWFEMVKWIPDKNGDKIYDRFTRMEHRPVNIPFRIQEIYKSFQSSPDRHADFLISMVMRHAEQNNLNHLEAFYDLRGAIKNHEVDIGPAIRWLRSEGFVVDITKLKEPSIINFGQLREWLKHPTTNPEWMKSERQPGDEDIQF